MFETHRTGPVLALAGELTIYHAAEARDLLAAELALDPPAELDLSGLEELDTAGVQVLCWAKREVRAKGAALAFIRHSPAVLEVIDQLSLARTFGDTLVIAPPA